MKKILIISPHFPPSNLASVHRSRLFAQHLPACGWEPIILMVHEKFYEEKLDYNLESLLPDSLHIEKVNAFSITRPRLIGDIGLRAFFQLYKAAKKIIKSEKIEFLYIPIPPFYVALLGRLLNMSTGVKYGIDYIDPWVHKFPGSNKTFSRHWWSSQIARILEPIALKNANLITGVAEGYYQGVIQRNPSLLKTSIFGAMPYGGEIQDHELLNDLPNESYLFNFNNGKINLVYAGAMLPKAYEPLEIIFGIIATSISTFCNIEFHFIGTGSSPNDIMGYNIKDLAKKYGLWQSIVFEYPSRIPYLQVISHLKVASGVFILGSTEPHYTPSKVYQAVLAKKPIFAVLNSQSSAVEVIKTSNAGTVLDFKTEDNLLNIKLCFIKKFNEYLLFMKNFSSAHVNTEIFDKFSAKSVTSTLADLLNEAMQKNLQK